MSFPCRRQTPKYTQRLLLLLCLLLLRLLYLWLKSRRQQEMSDLRGGYELRPWSEPPSTPRNTTPSTDTTRLQLMQLCLDSPKRHRL